MVITKAFYMLKSITWLPKQIFFAHYVLVVNLTHVRQDMLEIDRKCDQMHQRLFGQA